MGCETKCDVHVDDRSGQVRRAAGATVLLESNELIIRGEARVRVSRTAIERVVRRAGALPITAPAAEITLRLGADAAKGPHGIADIAIFAATKELGLTYTKVARVSEAESAEKLVWPRAMRAGKSRV